MDTEYLKKVAKGIITSLLLIGVIFYFGYHIWNTVTRDVKTEPVYESLTERTIECEGIIFRSERPIEKSAYGFTVPSVTDGTKVEAGGELAGIYSSVSSEYSVREAEIDTKIELLESITDSGTVKLKSTEEIDGEIYSALDGMRKSAHSGNIFDAAEYKAQLISEINKRELLTGTDGSLSDELNSLISEKAQLKSSLGVCSETLFSPVSGYYYSTADGYEEVFRSELLEDITYGDLEALLSKGAGTPSDAGKLVTSSVWYLVCPVGSEYAGVYLEGEECHVTLGASGTKLDMEVRRILSSDRGVFLILSSSNVPKGESFLRTVGVSLVTESYNCFRVPVNALRIVGDETGVYVLKDGKASFRRVKIIYKSENLYVADSDPTRGMTAEEKEEDSRKAPWLSLHDILITEGKGLSEGKAIGK